MSKKLLIQVLIFILLLSFYTLERPNLFSNNIIYAQDQNKKDKDKNKDEEVDYTKYCWNLTSLYRSDDSWRRELRKFNKEMNELDNYIGKVTKSKTHLSSALKIKEKLDRKLNSLSAYAKLKKDLNKNSYIYLNMNDEIKKTYSRYMKIISQLDRKSVV